MQLGLLVTAVVLAAGPGGCQGTHDISHRPTELVRPLEERTVDVIVLLRPAAADAFRRAGPDAGTTRLNEILRDFGASLQPQHPGISDPELERYFVASGMAPAKAEELAAALRGLDTVESAYVQPVGIPA